MPDQYAPDIVGIELRFERMFDSVIFSFLYVAESVVVLISDDTINVHLISQHQLTVARKSLAETLFP